MKNSKPQKLPGDGAQRRRAVEETGRSFIVEASAGTGKTRTLLDRILHLVLESGPDGSPVPLSRICAITFTEKAAGEMQVLALMPYLGSLLADIQQRCGLRDEACATIERSLGLAAPTGEAAFLAVMRRIAAELPDPNSHAESPPGM